MKWWYWLVIVIVAAVALFAYVNFSHAQMAQPTVSADVQQVLTQIHAVGCQAEEQASANTIAQLQKENAQLKAQIQKLDPPRSGATKK